MSFLSFQVQSFEVQTFDIKSFSILSFNIQLVTSIPVVPNMKVRGHEGRLDRAAEAGWPPDKA